MILDFDLNFLEDATALVDANLERLHREAKHREAKACPDPDAFGVFDQIDYIAGFGFVACQTYTTAVVNRSKLEKREALAAGPKHRTEWKIS